jgi:hypothetical protein
MGVGQLLIAALGWIGSSRRRSLFLIVLVIGALPASASAAPPTPPDIKSCPPGTTTTEVKFSVLVATGCFKKEGKTFVNTNPKSPGAEPYTLNGVKVDAPAAGKLQIKLTEPNTEPQVAQRFGHVFVSGGLCDPQQPGTCDGSRTQGGFGFPFLPRTNADFDLGPPPLKPTDDVPIFHFPGIPTYLGFPVNGEFVAALGKDKDGTPYWKFTANLKLPEIFKIDPFGAGGKKNSTLTFTVGMRIDRYGSHLDVKAEVKDAYLGPLLVKGLCLSYTTGGSTSKPCQPKVGEAKFVPDCAKPQAGETRWDTNFDIALGFPSSPALGLFGGFANGQFLYGGGKASQLNIRVAPGLKWQSVGGGVCVNPISASFLVGMTLGEEKVSALNLDGILTTRLSKPPIRLEALRLDVNLEHVTPARKLPLGAAFISYAIGSKFFEFGLDLEFYFPNKQKSIASVVGGLKGWIASPKFDIFGHAKVCVANVLCLGGEGAASSKGISGCVKVSSIPIPVVVKDNRGRPRWATRYREIRGGFGYIWKSKGVNVMGSACDVGPYRETKPQLAARSAGQRAAVAATSRPSLRVAPGLPAVTIRATGASGPPKLELIEPGGATITPPAEPAQLIRGRLMYVENTQDSSTAYMIVAPRAGVWELKDLSGGNITDVREANGEMPPSILSDVSKVRHDGYVQDFSYVYTPAPDHTISFVERGPNGTFQDLGPARGQPCQGLGPEPHTRFPVPAPRCGSIAFRPAEGAAGQRHIVAILSENGVAIDEQRVAGYDSPPPAAPAAVRGLVIHRQGTTITVTWNRPGLGGPNVGPTAVDDVHLVSADGASLLDVADPNHPRATFNQIDTLSPVTVAATPLRDNEEPGKSQTAVLRVGKMVSSG